nr:MAG TPA: Inclusion membrane protein E [Caudoviricetes sp.]
MSGYIIGFGSVFSIVLIKISNWDRFAREG